MRPYLFGVTAAAGIIGFYLGLLTLVSDWYNATSQFTQFWGWIIALAAGLGIQATLFTYIKDQLKGKTITAAKSSLAASGGVLGKPVKFEVRMNTHSVSLDQNIVDISILKDDLGQEYLPVNWNGSPAGGHHRSGVLEFLLLKGNPSSVTLVIQNIANVPERIFKWEMAPLPTE